MKCYVKQNDNKNMHKKLTFTSENIKDDMNVFGIKRKYIQKTND